MAAPHQPPDMLLAPALLILTAGAAAAADFLPQKPEALIDGQVMAVCYSGFRRGQLALREPDAGDIERATVTKSERHAAEDNGMQRGSCRRRHDP